MSELVKEFMSRFGAQSGQRSHTFVYMVSHLEMQLALHGEGHIVETGTARVKGNWADGQSTLIWDWLASKFQKLVAVSIDVDPKAIAVARVQTKYVHYFVGDSVTTLSVNRLNMGKTRLLYLDSFDWSLEHGDAAAAHHLAELQEVWDFLPKGCMIVVDDRHSDTMGKHVAVEKFLREKGIVPCFKHYQIGWIKP